jgi:L-ascorbate metabolism protein UlaG (beta-lactamase superfamily)
MDMQRAAWAARKWFDFRVMIPAHYGTFDLLAQDAGVLKAGLPGVDVRTPGVMEAVVI